MPKDARSSATFQAYTSSLLSGHDFLLRSPDLAAALTKNLSVQRSKLQKARDALQGACDNFEDSLRFTIAQCLI